jgi:hypothetical protein
MFGYRERRPRALVIAGAAEVQFLTAGKIKVQRRPRDERGGRVCDCSTGAFVGANEEQAVAGLHNNTGDARRELCPVRGFPTARLLERELRENQDTTPR